MVPDHCLSVTWLRCANTAVRIEVLLGLETSEDPRSIVLDGNLYFRRKFDAAFAISS